LLAIDAVCALFIQAEISKLAFEYLEIDQLVICSHNIWYLFLEANCFSLYVHYVWKLRWYLRREIIITAYYAIVLLVIQFRQLIRLFVIHWLFFFYFLLNYIQMTESGGGDGLYSIFLA